MAPLTDGKVSRRLIGFLLPILAGNLLQQLYNSIDAVIIGRYVGEHALGSVGVSQPIVGIIIALLIGLGAGTEILIGRAIGREDGAEVKRTVDTLFTSIMLLSVVLAAVGYFATPFLLSAIRTPPEQMEGAVLYLKFIFLGIPGIAGYNTLGGMIRATGNSRTPLFFLVWCSILNGVLDLYAIKKLGMGVEGAAIATAVAQTLSFLLCLAYVNRRSRHMRYNPLRLDFSWATLRQGMRCALPVSIQQGAMSVGALLLQVVVNGLGGAAVTAATIGGRIDSFAALPIIGIGQGLSVFTSQNMGAGRSDRVREAKRITLLWTYCIGALLLVLLWGFGGEMARFFGATGITVKMTEDYVRILSLGYFAAGYFTVIQGLIRGTGNTFAPMVITIAGFWAVRLPAAALLSIPLGYLGVWLSILVSWATTYLMTLIYYHSKGFQRALRLAGAEGETINES